MSIDVYELRRRPMLRESSMLSACHLTARQNLPRARASRSRLFVGLNLDHHLLQWDARPNSHRHGPLQVRARDAVERIRTKGRKRPPVEIGGPPRTVKRRETPRVHTPQLRSDSHYECEVRVWAEPESDTDRQ